MVNTEPLINLDLSPFQAIETFSYPLKTSENQRFSRTIEMEQCVYELISYRCQQLFQ